MGDVQPQAQSFSYLLRRYTFDFDGSKLGVRTGDTYQQYARRSIESISIEPERSIGLIILGAVLGLVGLLAFPGALSRESTAEMTGGLLFAGIGLSGGWFLLSTGLGRARIVVIHSDGQMSWPVDGVSDQQRAFFEQVKPQVSRKAGKVG